jgi:hypothetical protein
MRFFAILALLAATLLIAAPAQAARSTCVGSPGTSAVDEYCEVVPDGTGGRGAGGGVGKLPPKTAKQLEAAGPAGATIQGLVDGDDGVTPSSRTGGNAKDKASGSGGRTSSNKAQPNEVLVDQDVGASDHNIFEAAAASTGEATRMGPGFVWFVLAAVLAVGAWGWFSRRQRTD